MVYATGALVSHAHCWPKSQAASGMKESVKSARIWSVVDLLTRSFRLALPPKPTSATEREYRLPNRHTVSR